MLTLVLEYNEPWNEAVPADAIMERVSGYLGCIADGEAARYAPEAKSVRILIRYRHDPPPAEATRAFETLKQDALAHRGVEVVWESAAK